jgi:hypothetical protein
MSTVSTQPIHDPELLQRFLPKDFLYVYERLVLAEYGNHLAGARPVIDPHQIAGTGVGTGPATSSGQVDVRTVTRTGRPGASKQFVKSEMVFRHREALNKKLRRLIREAKDVLAAFDDPLYVPPPIADRKCSHCRKYGDPDWRYCARCGGEMVEVQLL